MTNLIKKIITISTTTPIVISPIAITSCNKEEIYEDFVEITFNESQNKEFSLAENQTIIFEFDIDHQFHNKTLDITISTNLSTKDENKNWIKVVNCEFYNKKKKILITLTTQETGYDEKPDLEFSFILTQWKETKESTSCSAKFISGFKAHYTK